jgi:site-specific recombinase XerD
MSVKPHPTNPGEWIIDCRPGGYKGKRERVTFPGTEEQAREWERRMMRRHVDLSAPTARSLAGIYPAWMASYKIDRAPNTVKDAEYAWAHQKEIFGKLQPKVITRQLIERYKQLRLTAGVKPRTINKELSYLSSLLKWAAENDFCDPLPFAIPKFPSKMTKAPKPRPILPHQITEIYEVIEDEYKLVFLLMVDAGLRRLEAMTLTREQVEFESGIIFVTGKGSKERIVPITTDRLMLELLKKEETRGWLTVNKKTKRPYLTIRKALLRAAEKTKLGKHLYHHLLRHSFGTAATVAGYDLSALQSIMGHSSPNTTGIYQHMAGDYLRAQGRKLNDSVMKEIIKDNDPDI